jgi:hypothetical protein
MRECNGAPAERYLEPYLRNTLPEDAAREFEEHYYGCEVCLSQLEALEAVELKLGRQPRKAPGTLLHWPVGLVAAGAIAATLLLVLLGRQAMMRSPAPRQETAQTGAARQEKIPAQTAPQATVFRSSLRQLADMNLPVFQLPHVRGQSKNPAFDEGMQAYTRHDCAAAVKSLGQVKATESNGPMARLYSGVCLMQAGETDRAARNLKAAALVEGSAEQEAAWYYLGQIALLRDDAASARRYLSLTVASHGDFESRARSELGRIPAASNRP